MIDWDIQVTLLVAMPEWQFCIVMGEGFFTDPCAGTTYKGIYYTESAIYEAYFERNPGAEALI